MRVLRTGLAGVVVSISLACSSGGAGPGGGGGGGTGSPCGAGAAADALWTQTHSAGGNGFFALDSGQERVFARTWDGVGGGRMLLTADQGATWTQIGAAEDGLDILSIVPLHDTLLSGTWDGLHRSTSDGARWTPITPAGIPAGAAIRSMATIGAALLATTTGQVYESQDGGDTWAEAGTGLPAAAVVTAIASTPDAVLAGTAGHGVLTRTSGGATWTASSSGLTDPRVAHLAVAGGKVFAVTASALFVSADGGATWTADGSGLANVNHLLAAGDRLLAGTDDAGVYLSADGGATWAPFSAGLPDGARVWSLAATGAAIFAGTDSGIWCTPLAAAGLGTVRP